MSNYPKLTITHGGHDMIAEAEADQKPLIFTRVKIGEGQLAPGQNIETLTDVLNEKMTLPLNSGQKLSTGGAKLRFVLDNSALETGFFAREVAVYGKVGESGTERLYAYTNGGNYVDYIPDKTNPIDAQIIDVYLVTGNAVNVQIAVSSSAYATIYDVSDAVAAHNIAPDAHENRFAAVMAALGGYLPLTGGVMSGAITVGNCPGMRKATDREEAYLYGGTTNQDGAAFGLRGVNCTVYGEELRGSFSIVAKSPSGETHTLSGLKDGRLLWDGKALTVREDLALYLPLSGGVMSGNVLAREDKDSFLFGFAKGALLALRGKSYVANPEGFELIAGGDDPATRKYLAGSVDGTLTWNLKPIIYPQERITWQSPTGEEWYYAIRWPDGRAEIHGHAMQQANTLGITLNYPIPLIHSVTGEATVVASAGSAFNGLVSFTFGTSSVGYFTVRYYDYSVPTEPISICFNVRGYWK